MKFRFELINIEKVMMSKSSYMTEYSLFTKNQNEKYSVHFIPNNEEILVYFGYEILEKIKKYKLLEYFSISKIESKIEFIKKIILPYHNLIWHNIPIIYEI